MKLIWCSDIHLNFLSKNPEQLEAFYRQMSEAVWKHDEAIILITGDIAESHNVVRYIKEIEEGTDRPVHFVLGNHDFYGSSVKTVRNAVKKLDGWLGQAPVELVRNHTILIGVDGWGDCRNGDYDNSRLVMSDWLYIDELRKAYGQGMNELRTALQKLADADVRKLKRNVLKYIKLGYKKIIIASHVPPFEEACLYAGRKSTPSGLPFFSSKCLGDAILPIAKKNPDVDFLWLSGHTHSRATFHPSKNMAVKVAHSEYFVPQIAEVFNLTGDI